MPTDTERLDWLAKVIRKYSARNYGRGKPRRDGFLHFWENKDGCGIAAHFMLDPYPKTEEAIEGRGATLREAIDAAMEGENAGAA